MCGISGEMLGVSCPTELQESWSGCGVYWIGKGWGQSAFTPRSDLHKCSLWRLSFLCNTLKTLSRARRILYLNNCVPVPAACSGPHWDFELQELLVLKCLSESWNLFCGTATRHVHGQSFPCEGLHHLLVLFCSWNARNDLLCALCWVPGRVRKLRAVALWELHGREVQEQQDQLGEGLNLMETVDITVTFKF